MFDPKVIIWALVGVSSLAYAVYMYPKAYPDKEKPYRPQDVRVVPESERKTLHVPDEGQEFSIKGSDPVLHQTTPGNFHYISILYINEKGEIWLRGKMIGQDDGLIPIIRGYNK